MSKFIQICLGWAFQRLNLLANLTAENLALRHQLLVLKRNHKRPTLKDRDRMFWVVPRKYPSAPVSWIYTHIPRRTRFRGIIPLPERDTHRIASYVYAGELEIDV